MIQKKDDPIPYKCTECDFTVTQYYDTKLYALHTILVNGEEKKPLVICLGDNLNHVKNIARNINMLNLVYLVFELVLLAIDYIFLQIYICHHINKLQLTPTPI